MNRTPCLPWLLLVAGGLPPLAAQRDPLAVEIRNLERVAGQLAGKGHPVEFEQLLAALRRLGARPASLTALEQRGRRSAARAKGRRPAPGEAKALRRVAGKLGGLLAALPEERRRVVAEVVLQLDPAVVAAHDALGHVEHRGRRMPAGLVAVRERRDALRVGYQASRKRDFELVEGPSELPAVTAVAAKGHQVRYRTVSLHSPTIPPARLRRILTEALRAWTYSNFLETGKVEPPPAPRLQVVLVRSKAEYHKTVEEALAHGGIAKKYADAARNHWGVHRDDRGFHTGWNVVEAAHAAFVFRELHAYQNQWSLGGTDIEPVPPNLHKGHLEWIGRACLGAKVPEWGWIEIRDGEQAPGTKATIENTPERVELVRLAQAGLTGVRAYLRYLVRRNEDPKFSATIVDKAGYLTGELLLKSISLAEYLHETGRFFPLFRKARGKPLTAAAFTELLGEDLGLLEQRWRQWLLMDDAANGLADRVDDRPKGLPVPGALRHLNAVRARVFAGVEGVVPVGIDASLSAASLAHVRYLLANPAQQSAWPDVHEEYSDRPGFTPEGCWAAGHSVIDPGAKTGEQAVDRWLATFYHRLPLLHPGLLRIGWAHERDLAVLDSGSLVDDGWARPLCVAYPPPGATKVPLAFVPELPNPVPDVDSGSLGYPVTLQLFGVRDVGSLAVRLRLYKGSIRPDNEVPCHVSTPSAPSNPALAPVGTFCLLPKAHLQRSTTYVVGLDGAPADAAALLDGAWRFKTGAR